MIEDPIVAEIRRYRKDIAEKYGNNIRRLAEALRERERESGHKVDNPGPKRRLDRTGS